MGLIKGILTLVIVAGVLGAGYMAWGMYGPEIEGTVTPVFEITKQVYEEVTGKVKVEVTWDPDNASSCEGVGYGSKYPIYVYNPTNYTLYGSFDIVFMDDKRDVQIDSQKMQFEHLLPHTTVECWTECCTGSNAWTTFYDQEEPKLQLEFINTGAHIERGIFDFDFIPTPPITP
ncbi:MAG: hypothetical protein WBC40_09750 [Halobacteriota archaeon]